MISDARRSETLLLSFLGTGNYRETTYAFRGMQHQSQFVVSSLAEFLNPDRVVLLTTEPARNKNLTACMTDLGTLREVQDVPIQEGSSEADIWQIFGRICEVVPSRSTVWLDITHGFRSLPLLGFLAIAYLKHSKAVQVEGMVYGAFEAQDGCGITPVFDLSPSLELLDWLSAMDRLRFSGDARAMGDLVIGKHAELYQAGGETEDKPRKLYGVGKSLQLASQAYLIGRPMDYIQHIAKVPKYLDEAADEIQKWLPPFREMADELKSMYADYPEDELDGTRRYIRDLMARNLFAQAIPVAQEWMISVAAAWLGFGSDGKGRERAQAALQQLKAKEGYSPRNPDEESALEMLKASPMAAIALRCWDELTQFRNDLQHCGHRDNRKPLGKMPADSRALIQKVLECPAPGVGPGTD